MGNRKVCTFSKRGREREDEEKVGGRGGGGGGKKKESGRSWGS